MSGAVSGTGGGTDAGASGRFAFGGLLDRELVRFGFQALRQSRKMRYALLASLLPLAVGIIMFANDLSAQGDPGRLFRPDFTSFVAGLVLSGTVPFVALLLAGGMLADEVEDRTLTYLLVRPIPRRTLYASKAFPVVATAAALGALQALLFGLCRLLAAVSFGMDRELKHFTENSAADPATISAPMLILLVLPGAVLAAALAGALFAALFGLVSLLTTRFHFLANLILLAAWEIPIGHLGGTASYLTITHWGTSLVAASDPTIPGLTGSDANGWLAIVWMAAWTLIWVWVGTKWIPKKDFNITSAAT